MNLESLKKKLSENNIPDSIYSIDDGLKSNAYILYKNYLKWEFFYLDERGDRNDFQIFHSEDEAFDYLWQKIETEMKYPTSKPPKAPPENFLW